MKTNEQSKGKRMRLLFCLFFAVLCIACASRRVDLTGHWQYADGVGNRSDIVFREDGTFSGSLQKDERPYGHFSGVWSLQGTSIRYTYISSSVPTIQIGTKDEDVIVEMASCHLIIKAIDGATRKYLRFSPRCSPATP